MKKIFCTFVTSLLVFAACTKEGGHEMSPVVGDWHYTSVENEVAEDVWISFDADGTFEMFQKIGEGAYWYSTGKYDFNQKSSVLSGMYSDKYPWKYTYDVSLSGKILKMTARELPDYTVTYTKETIPASVREKSLPLTKSENTERYL